MSNLMLLLHLFIKKLIKFQQQIWL